MDIHQPPSRRDNSNLMSRIKQLEHQLQYEILKREEVEALHGSTDSSSLNVKIRDVVSNSGGRQHEDGKTTIRKDIMMETIQQLQYDNDVLHREVNDAHDRLKDAISSISHIQHVISI